MAITNITSPTTPIAIGAVASNTWASQVEDTNNWLYNIQPHFSVIVNGSTGNIVSSFNVTSANRSSAGVYTVTLTIAATSSLKLLTYCALTPVTPGFIGSAPTSTTVISVKTWNTSSVATDYDFQLLGINLP